MESYILGRDEAIAVLKDVLPESVDDIEDIKIYAGAQKGDGYLSCMNKIDVKCKKNEYNYVFKMAPKVEMFRMLGKIERYYQIETRYYTETFPQLLKFQLDRKVKEPFQNIPKCIKTSLKEGDEYLLLENICASGFRLWNRRERFTENHLKLLFREYGKLHAISYAMKDQDRNLYDKLTSDNINLFYAMYHESEDAQKAWHMTLDFIQSYFDPKTESDCIAAVKRLRENLDKIFELVIKKDESFVIVHGDCWSNNMMFKYEDSANPKRPTKVCIYDFQLAGEASPIQDLSYFFYSGADAKDLTKLNDFLRIYYESMKSYCKLLGTDVCKYMTYEKLKNHWKLYNRFGLAIGLMSIRAQLMEREEVMDAKDVNANTDLSEAFKNMKMQHEDLIRQRQKALVKFAFKSNFM